jgi:toxin ParE1/3/4
MPPLHLTPRANSDLLEIWAYIADDNERAADSFIDQLREAMHKLGEHPELGRRRDELAPGIRSFPFRRYVVFYRLSLAADRPRPPWGS